MELGLLVIMTKSFTPSEFISMASDRFDTLVFDLDNTIYDENEFLFNRYSAIAELVACNNVSKVLPTFEYLRNTFQMKGRAQLFDNFLSRFNLKGCHTVEELITCMRQPLEDLTPFNYFEHLVRSFHGRLYLVTNGNPSQQQNKLIALGIVECFSGIVFADTLEKKPSKISLMPLLTHGRLGRAAYIGDSDVDYAFAINCRLPFLRINFKRDLSGLVDQKSIRFYENL